MTSTIDTASASVWFLVLEDALDRNDFELAARAKARLEELGVEVHFRMRKANGEPAKSNSALGS